MDATYTPESEATGNDWRLIFLSQVVMELTDEDFERLKNLPHDGLDLPDPEDDDL